MAGGGETVDGKTTMMAAGDGADVTELSAQARAERVAAGQVESGGVTLRDGNLAGAGDWVVTRANDRRLSVNGGRDWVKNGDAWRVERRRDDGSLTVRNMGHGGRVTLPAAYVRAHVQLLYAYTAHRVQGDTVDTGHDLVTPGMTREALYVLASRAREKTTFYVATHDMPFDEDTRVDRVRTDPRSYAAREILTNIIMTEGAAMPATETITAALEEAGSLATLVPRYLHAAHLHAEGRYRQAAAEALGENGAREITEDEAWGAVVRRLYDAEASGWEPARLLTAARGMRELDTADSIAEVFSWRIDVILKETPQPARDGAPYESAAQARARLASAAAAVLGSRHAGRAQGEAAWPALIAALRRAENDGQDAAQFLKDVIDARELHDARSISEVLAWRIRRRLPSPPGPAQATPAAAPGRDAETPPAPAEITGNRETALPWLTAPPHAPDIEAGTLPAYLHDSAELIGERVSEVAERAVRERPAWMSMLGQQPADPGNSARWLRHIAIISSFRDQHQITTSDPRQVLGPYREPGHAGHAAYWHAAESVLAARRLAGLDQPQPGRAATDRALTQVAADIYRSLPEEERAAVAATIAADSGVLWFGDRIDPDEDTAARPAYADGLTAALARRGHLTTPGIRPNPQYVPAEEPVEAALARRARRTQQASAGSQGPAARERAKSPAAIPRGNLRAGPPRQDPARHQSPRR